MQCAYRVSAYSDRDRFYSNRLGCVAQNCVLTTFNKFVSFAKALLKYRIQLSSRTVAYDM